MIYEIIKHIDKHMHNMYRLLFIPITFLHAKSSPVINNIPVQYKPNFTLINDSLIHYNYQRVGENVAGYHKFCESVFPKLPWHHHLFP